MKIIVFILALILVIMFAGTLASQISYAVSDMFRDPYRVDESAALYGALAGAATYGILIGSLIYLYRKLWPKETNPDQALEATYKNQPVASAKSPDTAKVLEDKQTEKSNTADREDQVSIATRVAKKEKKSAIDLIDEYPNAKTVIEYEALAADYWKKLDDKEESLRSKFLIDLNRDPQQNIQDLYDRVLEEYEADLNPYKDAKTNNAYQEAVKISNEAKVEFQRVYELLGSKITPDELLKKIRDKFAPATKLNLYDGWEDELMKSEWTGDISSMLTALNKIGYSVNTENKSIVRPSIGGSPPIEMGYSDANDLMTKVAFERKMLVFNNLIDLG